jgi:hypothetical protein
MYTHLFPNLLLQTQKMRLQMAVPNIFFSGQNAYPHGTHMCTTACMHVAMATLCRLLDFGGCARSLKTNVEGIMQLASMSHAGFEQQGGCPRMLSVHEILSECGINLPGMGISSKEYYVVDHPSAHTRRQECFVEFGDLPSKLREHLPCAAMATGNGHTVCMIYYEQDKFAFFDSLPGLLATNLDEAALMKRAEVALNLKFLEEEESEERVEYRRGKKIIVAEPVFKKKKRVHFLGDNAHQCDVTVLWK